MEQAPSSRSRGRHLIGLAVIVAMWWIAFHGHDRLPIVTYVNLGIHEFGHLLTYAFSDLVTAVMGSVAQIGAPLACAAYFLIRRGDWMAASLCMAWAATSSLEVAVYVADAPYEELQLIGGMHDWAFILGPDGYDAIEKAAPLAGAIRDGALITMVSAFALCLAGCARVPLYDEPVLAATSFATPDSSAWAASATSGSAPRSASSPQYTPPS